MRRKRSAPLAVGVMVVRLILQDEIRALKNKPGQQSKAKRNKKKTTKNTIINKTQVPTNNTTTTGTCIER